MAETIFRGPGVSLGSLMDGRVEAFDGPSIGYQGDVICNPIFSPEPKDGLAPGRMHGWYNAFYTVSVDAIPSTSATNIVAAAQTPSTTAAIALTLKTAQAATAASVTVFCPGVPIQPLGTNSIVTVAAIDFGFTTGTTAANSSTVSVVDNRLFTLGQWICIPGAGAAGNTNTPLFTQVTALATANITGMNILPVAATALVSQAFGQANLYSQLLPAGTQFGPSTVLPNAVEPYRVCGLAAGLDPAQSVTRNLSITAASIGSGTSQILVTGYDIYGQLMTEVLTANGTTTVYGKKAFKYVLNAVSYSTAATTGNPATVALGLGDVIGMNIRSDRWEFSDIFYNGGFAINSTGWTAAITTPQTNTTGDVRGAVNCSTILVGSSTGSAAVGGTLDGVKRVTIFQNVQFYNAISATPLNYTSILGVGQSST